MKQRDIIFYSEGSKIRGTIYLPHDNKEGEKRPGIVANSGWTGLNKVYPAMFARAFTKYGYVVMGFDYRGFKPSSGISGMDKYTTLEMEVDDVNNAVTFFKHQPEVDASSIALIGWGVGGAVCVNAAYRDKTVKAVATLNSFTDGRRWMRMGMGNDKFNKMLRALEDDKLKRVTTGDPVLRHPYEFYPNIDESGDFYVDSTLKKLNGGLEDTIQSDYNEPFPTPMSSIIAESFIRFNVQDILPKLAPDCAVFVGHGKYNELHDREEADDAYRLANEPKMLYFVEGKHNEWMFDEDPKLHGLGRAINDFFKANI